MKIREGKEEDWKKIVAINQKDDYSKDCVIYAESWANLIENGMKTGLELENIAWDASFKAEGIEEITGFMVGMAAGILSEVWEHGDQLKIWWNKRHGMKPEQKGVANPALVTVETPDDVTKEQFVKDLEKTAKEAGFDVKVGMEFEVKEDGDPKGEGEK